MTALVLAHGIGVRGDLPLPLWAVSYGAAAVLVVTFGLLLRTWRQPRLEGAGRGVSLGEASAPVLDGLTLLARIAGVGAFGVVVAAALTGPASDANNLAPFALYVGAWVGGAVANSVLGDVWRALNPFETLARVLEPLHPGPPPAWLERAGVWLATAALLGFVWLELVHPQPGDPRLVGATLVTFAGVAVVGGLWWGPRWPRAVDPFGALFSLFAAIAPFHRDERGRLRLRAPFTGLAQLEPRPGTTALVLVALGSTSFDGLSGSRMWEAAIGAGSGWSQVPLNTVGLLGMIGLVAALYLWGAGAIAREAPHTGLRATADRFVHSLVPIALGYAVAHYFSLLVFSGQRMLKLASDPLGTGADWLGTAAWQVDLTAASPLVIGIVQVGAIVGGHVVGVVLAHDRAVAVLPDDADPRSQYPLLVAMVGYTIGGLVLLLGA